MVNFLAVFCAGVVGAAGSGAGPAEVSPASATWAEYDARKASTGPGAAAQVRLALWCEEHGLTAQRHQHLAKAVLIESGNVLARGLMGFMEHKGQWLAPEKVAAELRSDDPRNAALAEYNGRRDKLDEQTAALRAKLAAMETRVPPRVLSTYRAEQNRNLAMDRLKLGLWSERAGLTTEAKVEFTTAVLLDTHVEDGWKHLGYVRHDGRWMPAEQVAAEVAEAKAQIEANRHWEPALKKWKGWLRDPKLEAEAKDQLGQVTDPRAVVAVERVFLTAPNWESPIKQVDRALGVRILRQIDAPASTAVLAKLAAYCDTDDVGSSAVAILKTRPPQDYLQTLVNVIRTPAQYSIEPVQGPGTTGTLVIDTPRYHLERSYNTPSPFELGGNFYGYVGYDVNGLPVAIRGRELKEGLVPERLAEFEERTAEMIVGAQFKAMATQERIREDARALDRANARTMVVNTRVAAILEDSFNAPDLGNDEIAWQRWYYDRVGYSYTPPPKVYASRNVPGYSAPSLISCFAAGTIVRTLDGPRPIEEVRPGDRILTQNTTTGALAFQPALVAHHNPPCQTLRLTLEGGEVLLPSIYHRFWITGKGWALARDLKAGDALRLIDGRAKVATIEPAEVVPVFNLTVSGHQTYFVGQNACLVHDNTLPGTLEQPFDALTTTDRQERATK